MNSLKEFATLVRLRADAEEADESSNPSDYESNNNRPQNPSPIAQPFGRQDYWESLYDQENTDFSWYSSWEDMEPFVLEWQPPPLDNHDASTVAVLVPGVGSDASLLQSLYHAGYTRLAAFDYAPSSIAHCQRQLAGSPLGGTVDLAVADATQRLPYPAESMHLILDKGTLDSIYIAGSTPVAKVDLLRRAVRQLQRVLMPGGIFWSLSGICTHALLLHDDLDVWEGWEPCADTTQELVMTADGYASNSLDGNLLVWRKPLTARAESMRQIGDGEGNNTKETM